jgi:type III secretion protein C
MLASKISACLVLLGVVVLFAASGPTSAGAAALILPGGTYPYSVVEQDVSVALREFGHNVGLYVDVSPKVQGRLRGRLARSSARDFLDNVCGSYALDWYFDGYTLYISTVEERATRFLSLRGFSLQDVTSGLQMLGFDDDRYPLHAGPNGMTVIASGPPRYVALVEQTVGALPHPENLRLASRTDAVSQTVIYRGASTAVVKFAPDSNAPDSKK